jgi:riboflavin kinase/FMN adenylyltransferase
MLTFVDIAQVQISGPTILTIGNFDGLHRGHQALLQIMLQLAQERTPPTLAGQPLALPMQTALLTFHPHPLTVLRPQQSHWLLTTPYERLALAADIGIHIGVVQTFTSAFAGLDARSFMELLKRHLGLAVLVVGPDFALGRNRTGDLATLRQLGDELGYILHIVEPISWQGKAVRSSAIRQAVQTGDVGEAADLLGRPYRLTGEVVLGDQRGRQLGIPTANLLPPTDKLLPAYGVYATRAYVPHAHGYQLYSSVTNLGVRPTVDGLNLRVETHLLDFPPVGQDDNLYGKTLQVEFVARLRGEQRFPSLDALVAQIHADMRLARQML